MEWQRLVIGGRVRLNLPSGDADGGCVEITGQLLGRDHAKFIELGVPRPPQDSADFRAVVKLDDGTLVLVELDSIVGRDDQSEPDAAAPPETGAAARASIRQRGST